VIDPRPRAAARYVSGKRNRAERNAHPVHAVGAEGQLALLAGLLLIGAGMGLCITPLTTTVLASADPQRAGAVSGILSTMQQVGNALGVAITGVIFFDASRHGIAHAFQLSLIELALLLVAVALLSRPIPRPSPTVHGTARP
jgi:predicted MFS family arabinose efflux permease